MSFDYEQSIWGRGEASLLWSQPTAFRLRQALTAMQSLPTGSSVLEVGCGAGQFIRAVKKIRPEFSCFGCDISHEAINAAEENRDGVIYSVSDSQHFPYADRVMDAVLIFDVLEHVETPEQLLAEVRRVLKPGGILYAFVPCEGDWLSLWHLLDWLHLKRNLTRQHAGHIQYFSRRELFSLVWQENFKINRVRYSEHLLGQMAGVAAFWLMGRAAKRRGLKQINNESYFNESAQSNSLIRLIKIMLNGLIYLESRIFSSLPSPNVHITAQKL